MTGVFPEYIPGSLLCSSPTGLLDIWGTDVFQRIKCEWPAEQCELPGVTKDRGIAKQKQDLVPRNLHNESEISTKSFYAMFMES